jgi:hypothetical protein
MQNAKNDSAASLRGRRQAALRLILILFIICLRVKGRSGSGRSFRGYQVAIEAQAVRPVAVQSGTRMRV